MNTEKYFKDLDEDVRKVYAMAEVARGKGLDPVSKVEIPLAKTMAEKVVKLISNVYPQMDLPEIPKRILELEKEHGKLDNAVAFKIAEEVAKQKYCKFSSLLEAIEAGVRIGFAYMTLGVVSSPIEGFTKLKLAKTRQGKDYFVVYFSGPIRSAGTTASCMVLILINHLRELFGYAKYDPTEDEIGRVATELEDFHGRITNLQYMPTQEESLFLAKNMPIQVNGEPSEKIEVSNYKNLKRVETNYLRSGFCLIMAEGLAQKAKKGLRLLNKLKSKGICSKDFDFLDDYVKIHEKRDFGKVDASPTYINDLVAGRPVFGHPSKSGGFRFRYGRGRTSGFSAVSLHPATMGITDGFIATGTQLKIEKPTKGCVATVCDVIDGPIVKLVNGSVKKLQTLEEARKIYPDVEEIIYLGDILFPFSDIVNRNSDLIKPGYVEEWWDLELKQKGGEVGDYFNVDFEKAVELSKQYKIPFYPKYIFYWSQISQKQFLNLIKWLRDSRFEEKIILPYNKKAQEKFEEGKRALELLGVEHKVTIENVVLNLEDSKAFLSNFGIFIEGGFSLKDKFFEIENKINSEKSVLENINCFSEIKIKDKAGEFIGARMGRPEKAKLRKLVGSPNVLFPVGSEGGRLRSVQAACEVGCVKSSFPIYFCEKCEKETIYPICENCKEKTKQMFYFPETKQKSFSRIEQGSDKRGFACYTRDVDIKHYFEKAVEKLGLSREKIPVLIKGVRGTVSSEHKMEHLCKGILRASFDLQVNKDGTIRFDATELPIVSFKPKEVSVSILKLKELGYDKDIFGKKLVDENQILEIMPHDVLLPSAVESPDEKADDVFCKVCNYVDDLLVKFYGLKPFYNLKKREDLVGQLGVCMAPHNCAGVVCRFIGFSNTLGLYASPYMHAAIRRDCFDYNTYISIKKNGFWRNLKIGELVENLNPKKLVDTYGTKEKKVNDFETLGFDNKSKKVKINNFTKHTKSLMFEIKTSLGKKIKVTENHKFLIDGKIKRANKLKIGDKLPLLKKIIISSKDIKEINLLDFLNDEKLMVRKINNVLLGLDEQEKKRVLEKLKITKKQFMNYKIRNSYPLDFILSLNNKLKKEIYKKGKIAIKKDSVEVPIIIKLEKDLLEIIGLYIAKGYSRHVSGKKGLNQAYISSYDGKLREFIKKTIKTHFDLNPSERKKDRVTFSSKVLYLFFTKILECGSVAREKRIPYLFLSLPLEKLSAVLRGYFEGDGSVSLSDMRVTCDSVSEGLLSDLEFCLARFGIFVKRYEYEKKPGPKIREFYLRKNREIPKFKITKLIIGSDFIKEFMKINFLSKRKKSILEHHKNKSPYGMRIEYNKNFVYDPIISIEKIGEKESYCLNVGTKNHLVVGNSILTKQCDGDEAAVMLLGDVLLNFSKEFLPSHRGGTQDAPLVLNSKINAGEVDDQILDFEITNGYPLELYQLAEQGKHSSEVKIKDVSRALKLGEDPFVGLGFTHSTNDFNSGVVCSSYKSLGTMQEKVQHQMELVERLRSADTVDTARLIIDKHFLRDMKGNLRKFSTQTFRCVKCNEIMRRLPLSGVCPRCSGKVIFTVSEGGVKKYLEAALTLAKKYNLSNYLQQNLEITKRNIDAVFGKELEKQKPLSEFF